MRQKVADGVHSALFEIMVRPGVEEQTCDGLRREASHRIRRDTASRSPVQHPLRHEAIGGVEDHEGSSIEGGEDVFDQTLVAATLFPDRLTKARHSCSYWGSGFCILTVDAS